jgi:hypothetical protein
VCLPVYLPVGFSVCLAVRRTEFVCARACQEKGGGVTRVTFSIHVVGCACTDSVSSNSLATKAARSGPTYAAFLEELLQKRGALQERGGGGDVGGGGSPRTEEVTNEVQPPIPERFPHVAMPVLEDALVAAARWQHEATGAAAAAARISCADDIPPGRVLHLLVSRTVRGEEGRNWVVGGSGEEAVATDEEGWELGVSGQERSVGTRGPVWRVASGLDHVAKFCACARTCVCVCVCVCVCRQGRDLPLQRADRLNGNFLELLSLNDRGGTWRL